MADEGNDVLTINPTDANTSAEESAPRRRRRRSSSTPEQRISVAIITAFGCVAGAFSPGAPTGHTVVDVAYRIAFVGIMAIAGSRARRWSLITGSAIAAIGSIGFALFGAVIALTLSVFLVGRDQRNRVYGAAIGLLIALSLLRLEVGGFVGSSALVAAAGSGVVLFSGYRMMKRRTRQRIRWAAAAVAVLLVVGLAMALYQAVAFGSRLESAARETSTGVELLQSGKTQQAADRFGLASRQFAEVAAESGRPWFLPVWLVPTVAQNVNVVSVLSDSGASLTEAARRSSSTVEYQRLSKEGGGIDLSVLAEFASPVRNSAARLSEAANAVSGLRSPWVVGMLADKVDEFSNKVGDLRGQADLAALAVDRAPELLGSNGERRYLVLVGNPAEARDVGGHIGNWAELVAANGALHLQSVGRPLELSRPQYEASVTDAAQFPPSVLTMKPATYPQNWGTSVDFPTDARLAAQLFERATGRKIDGVFYADPFVLAQLLKITGPVQVPALHRSVGAGDAVKFLTVDQFSAFEQTAAADEAITKLTEDLFHRFTSSKLPGPREMSQLFGPLAKQGRVRFVSLHDQDAPLIAALGLSNGFPGSVGSDVLAVVNRNANPSKIDSFLHRRTEYDVAWNPETGTVSSHVVVDLYNAAPRSGLSNLIIGNQAGFEAGTNVTELSVITPFEATGVKIDGVATTFAPLWDKGVWRATVRAVVPSQVSVRVEFDLRGELEPGDVYRLRFGGQPLVNSGDTFVSVTLPKGHFVPGAGVRTRGPKAIATLSGEGITNLTLRSVR